MALNLKNHLNHWHGKIRGLIWWPNKKSKVLAVWKPFGLTPLQALDKLRANYPKYEEAKLSYAGRLDPMAEGVMLVLVDEANFEREKYLNLDKEYQVGFLVGAGTDSADLLGLINRRSETEIDSQELELKMGQFFNQLIGGRTQTYPTYSSPKIAGQYPTPKLIAIYKAQFLGVAEIKKTDLQARVIEKLDQLIAYQKEREFRQEAIRREWLKFFVETKQSVFYLVTGKIKCSSGTYVRVLAEDLGEFLGRPTCVFAITRERVGSWSKKDILSLPL